MTNARRERNWPVLILVIVLVAGATIVTAALLMNIAERKTEAQNRFVRLVEVTEDDTDPEKWGKNWPRQYDSYKKTALATRARSN